MIYISEVQEVESSVAVLLPQNFLDNIESSIILVNNQEIEDSEVKDTTDRAKGIID